MVAHNIDNYGTRRYKSSEGNAAYFVPKEGHPYKRVEKTYELSGHDHRVTMFLPEGAVDPSLNGSVAGFMAPDAVYNENAAAMAALGYPAFTFEPANKQSVLAFIRNPSHITNPALFQSQAFGRAIKVAQDYTQAEHVNGIGHSYGGPILAEALAFQALVDEEEGLEPTIEFATFEATAAFDTENIAPNHIADAPKMLGGEVWPLLKKYTGKDTPKDVLPKSFAHIKHLGRRTRELIYLLNTPDLHDNVQSAHEDGVVTSALFHTGDAIFPDRRIRAAVTKRAIFNVVEFSEGTTHVDPNLRPEQNAKLRVEMLEKMKAYKLTQRIIEAETEAKPSHLSVVRN